DRVKRAEGREQKAELGAERREGLRVDDLLLEEEVAEGLEGGAVVAEDGRGAEAGLLEDGGDAALGRLEAGRGEGAAGLVAVGGEADDADLVAAEAELLDQRPRDRRGAAEVVGRADREVVEQH